MTLVSKITVTLQDEHLARIRELARGQDTTPEEWLRVYIETLLADPQTTFEKAAKFVLEKNQELYRRLA